MVKKKSPEPENAFLKFAPPGHYYSPIPDLADIEKRKEALFHVPEALPGIDLRVADQLVLFERFRDFYRHQPFPETKAANFRYYYDNGWFVYCDGFILHAMIRHLAPRRLIEIGSGFSSCNILDTNELFFNHAIHCTFIEPYPQRLYANIKKEDRHRVKILEKDIQDVPSDTFAGLAANDILFIDSTHISRIGSDVNRILFQILPNLKDGVYIHFHDIFYPFEYPLDWYRQGRCWNEAYLLRAFLQYNPAFKIVFFNTYMCRFFPGRFQADMPLCLKNTGGSLWLKKTGVAGRE